MTEENHIDDHEDFTDTDRWCPHGWGKLQPEGISLCPECSAQAGTT